MIILAPYFKSFDIFAFLKQDRKQAGFTLIELLVASIVLVILSSILFISLNAANRRLDLDSAVQYLVSNIRLMQGKSLSPDSLNSSGVYGLYFTLDKNNEYILFEDKNNPPSYPLNDNYDENNFELIKKIVLPRNVAFSIFQTNIPELNPRSFSVVYKAPIPTVRINQNDSISYIDLVVTKSVGDVTFSKTVRIETSNNIEIR